MPRSVGLFPTTLAAIVLSGCSHLFYYPDAHVRVTPDRLGDPYTTHVVTEPDGTRLAVWHLAAQGKPRNAVVVHFHGNAENMTTHVLFVHWLAEQGFDVVTFDYRGYGASSGKPDREGLVADGEAVLAWVARQPSLAGKDLMLFGQSLGGAVAIPVAALAPQTSTAQLRAVVVDSTFDSYRHIARGKLDDLWLTWPLQAPLSFLVTDDLSPVDYVGRLKTPLLVVHGTDDLVVPALYGRALYDAARMRDKEFWAVPLPGHTSAFLEDDSPWRPRLVRYLSARLHGAS